MAMTTTNAGRRRRFRNALPAILAVILLMAAIFAGCGGGAQSGESKGDASDSGGDAPADQVVSYANPGATGVALRGDRTSPADDGVSLDAVRRTTEPTISAGALTAAGALEQGARLSEPLNDEPSAFSVYYGDNPEVLVELLPDLGPMRVWDTDATVAPSEFELAGDEFTIRAYSPLFMDVGPSDLLLRVWGYDAAGAAALLSVRRVAVE